MSAWQAKAAMLANQTKSDPVLVDFSRRAKTMPYRPIKSVEDVLGERATVVHVFALMGAQGDESAAKVASLANDAMPYLWTNQTRMAAKGLTLPTHVVVPDFLPHQSMWWTFETDLDVGAGSVAWGILWYGHARGIQVITLGEKAGRPSVLAVVHIPRGTVYPTGIEPSALDHVTAYLGMLSFLNSPYIPKAVKRMDSHLRRSMNRSGWVERPSDSVSFVDLRPAVSERTEKDKPGSPRRNRWVVRGHHRAQWYPSAQAHKVIWVAPYIKGPKDAPMKVPVYRVAR